MDRTRKLLLALAAAAVAATLLALRGWIAPATARWVLLALLGWYWVRFIVLPVDVIKRTKVLNAFAVTWWVQLPDPAGRDRRRPALVRHAVRTAGVGIAAALHRRLGAGGIPDNHPLQS